MTTRRRQQTNHDVDEMDLVPLTAVDREAMQRAIEMARREDASRRQQIDEKLKNESFAAVGGFAAYSCQRKTLCLKPWQFPPASMHSDEDVEVWLLPSATCEMSSRRAAAELLLRLEAAGLSRYEPDPIAALERVEGLPAESMPVLAK